MSRDASTTTIRAAYRERARQFHPDRLGADAHGAPEMAVVNEAYRVLGDPGRRALYDRQLEGPGRVIDDPVVDIDERLRVTHRPPASRLSPNGPARVPWKLMLVTAVVGSVVVVVTAAFNDPPSVEPPDGIIRAGSCVQIETNGDAREVACTNTPDDIVVDLLVPTNATCPAGLAAHRDRLGLGTACIPYDR